MADAEPASSSTFLSVPATVFAGAQATATIAAGTYFGGADTSAVRALELFLAVGNSSAVLQSANATESECYLTQDTPLCDIPGVTVHADHVAFDNVSLPFTIPPSAGNEGLLYALRLQVLQADGTVYGGGGASAAPPPSNAFFLTNTTARSSLFQTVEAPAAYVPCGELACVKDCFGALFGSTGNLSSESAACASACGGVDVPADWLEEDPASVVALSTVAAGTATGCLASGAAASGTGTGTGTATTSATGSTKSSGATRRRPQASGRGALSVALVACIGLAVLL